MTTQYPRWMEDMRDLIGDKSLRQIAIPASHDSGTYDLSDHIAPDARPISQWLPAWCTENWAKTQQMNIRQQLNAGIRALDLRICRFRNISGYDDHDVRIIHSLYGPKIDNVLQQVQDFMADNPMEIVILVIGTNLVSDAMSTKSNTLLCELIGRLFGPGSRLGDVLVPRGEGVHYTLNELWRTQPARRLIVAFDYGDFKQEFKRYQWAWNKGDTFHDGTDNQHGVQDLGSLRAGLEKAFASPDPDKFGFVSCCLTPDDPFIRRSPLSTLRTQCAEPAAVAALWLKYHWHNAAVNIVKFDYFDITLQVEVALAINCGKERGWWRYNTADTGGAVRMERLFLDTTPLRAPQGAMVVGVRLVHTATDARYQTGNRIAPVLYYRTPDGNVESVTNFVNNAHYTPITNDLHADSTPLHSPPGYVLRGLRFVKTTYAAGYATDNRIAPVLICAPEGGGSEIAVTNKKNNGWHFAGLPGLYADTTELAYDRPMVGLALIKSAYGEFATNNRLVPATTHI